MQWQKEIINIDKNNFFRRFDKCVYLDKEEEHEKHFDKEAFFGKCNGEEFYINLHFPGRKYFNRFVVVGRFIENGFEWKIKLNPSFKFLAIIWLSMLSLVIILSLLTKWWIFSSILFVGLITGTILIYRVSSEIKIKFTNIIDKIKKTN